MNIICTNDLASMPKPMDYRKSIEKARRFLVLSFIGALSLNFSALSDIPGNYTLAGNETFTSIAGDTFTIGTLSSTFNLQSHTATLSGMDDFDVRSKITGTGSVFIDLTDPTKEVLYQSDDGNTYTGLTTVRSGTLILQTPVGDNNGVRGNLYIGGGPNQAVVTRNETNNRELIANTATVTIASNGTLVLNRADSGNLSANNSMETFRKLILDGGTILNESLNTRRTTLNILDSIQLLSNSTIDMGVAMTISVGDVDTTPWTSGATLTIKNWSTVEPIYFGEITAQQLSQIQFETTNGLTPAIQIADGQIVPQTLVPEASTLALVPLLVGAVFWPNLKKRLAKPPRGCGHI